MNVRVRREHQLICSARLLGRTSVKQIELTVHACSVCKTINMLFEEINRIQRIDKLIRLSNTGNADEFAEKLGISRRQIYNIIEDLKDMGLGIVYNRQIRSFVYTKPYQIRILFEIVELSENETKTINAGTIVIKNTFLCNRIAQTIYSFGNCKPKL